VLTSSGFAEQAAPFIVIVVIRRVGVLRRANWGTVHRSTARKRPDRLAAGDDRCMSESRRAPGYYGARVEEWVLQRYGLKRDYSDTGGCNSFTHQSLLSADTDPFRLDSQFEFSRTYSHQYEMHGVHMDAVVPENGQPVEIKAVASNRKDGRAEGVRFKIWRDQHEALSGRMGTMCS